MTGNIVNLFMVYQFIKRLVQPFDKWDAFKEGVIDKDGDIIMKPSDRITSAQRNSFKTFDVMILKLKKLLGKLPFGRTKLATFGAALWLVKEQEDFEKSEKQLLSETYDIMDEFIAYYADNIKMIREQFYISEATPPTNVTGGVVKRPVIMNKRKKKPQVNNLLHRSRLIDKMMKSVKKR